MTKQANTGEVTGPAGTGSPVRDRAWATKMKMMITNEDASDDDDGSISPPTSDGGEDDTESEPEAEEEDIEQILSMQEKVASAIKEVHEFARYLGMDPDKDQKLLWIAVEAMSAPLPDGWAEYTTADGQQYFYNKQKDSTQWEHPLDEYHRQLYKKISDNPSSGRKSREGREKGGGKKLKAGRRTIFQPAQSESFTALPKSLPPTADRARSRIEREQGGGGGAASEARRKSLKARAQALAEEAARMQEKAAERGREGEAAPGGGGGEAARKAEEEARRREKAEKRARKKAKVRERLQTIKKLEAASGEEEEESGEEGVREGRTVLPPAQKATRGASRERAREAREWAAAAEGQGQGEEEEEEEVWGAGGSDSDDMGGGTSFISRRGPAGGGGLARGVSRGFGERSPREAAAEERLRAQGRSSAGELGAGGRLPGRLAAVGGAAGQTERWQEGQRARMASGGGREGDKGGTLLPALR